MQNITLKKIYLILILSSVTLSPSLQAEEMLKREISPIETYTYPQKIISLGPSITKDLYLLGLEEQIIANTVYCAKTPAGQEKEKIGTVLSLNIEKIVSLKPDLVIATNLTDQRQLAKLKKLGLQAVQFSQPNSFAQMCAQLAKLGSLTGRKEKALKIIEETKNKVMALKTISKNCPAPKVFIQLGSNPLFTVTKDSFINDFIEFAGGINITKQAASGLYSREKVIYDNPDIIIITTMGLQGYDEKKTWYKYTTIDAVKNNRIYIIDEDSLCSPTVATFPLVLKEIILLLHPEFKNTQPGLTPDQIK